MNMFPEIVHQQLEQSGWVWSLIIKRFYELAFRIKNPFEPEFPITCLPKFIAATIDAGNKIKF